jgi:hypothetical protein
LNGVRFVAHRFKTQHKIIRFTSHLNDVQITA